MLSDHLALQREAIGPRKPRHPAWLPSTAERRVTGRVALIYAVAMTIWITGSDLALLAFTGTSAGPAIIFDLIKGFGFIAVSTAILYLVVARVVTSLSLSQRRLQLLAEHVPDMIYRLRVYPDYAFEYVSPAATRLAGYSPAEFYANASLAHKLVHPADRERLASLSLMSTTEGLPVELRWVRKDNAVIWTEQRNVSIYDAHGRLVAIEGVARDITDRKNAEEQICWQRHALERAHKALVESYDTTLSGWSHALDLRDHETEGHSARVTALSIRLAQQMGLGGEALEHFRRGALLHDIGKIGIPDAILHKPGPLSDAEWAVMHRHPEFAHDLLAPIDFLRPALDIPYCHHERWNGTGYPRGLKGDEIPMAARIFAVVDVWDALTSSRPYRAAWSDERVRAYIGAHAGDLFDPAVVRAFLALIEADDQRVARWVA